MKPKHDEQAYPPDPWVIALVVLVFAAALVHEVLVASGAW